MKATVLVNGSNTHSTHEDRQVSKCDCQRMARPVISSSLQEICTSVLRSIHRGKRPHTTEQIFGIVLVMVIVRSVPHARRAQNEKAVGVHEKPGESGP